VIARLTGRIHPLGLDEIVVEVGGVGYHVHVPIGTPQRVKPDDEGHITLSIHTAVREDAIQLFGFATEQDKAVYKKLIGVSGIGPRTGLNVLSELSVNEVVKAVASEDKAAFKRVSGIGNKTAQRLLLELQNAFDDLPVSVSVEPHVESPEDQATLADLRSGLTNLGYKPNEFEPVIDQLLEDVEGQNLDVLMRRALKILRG
jgi:Holliday junction DNA helicase RuvA